MLPVALLHELLVVLKVEGLHLSAGDRLLPVFPVDGPCAAATIGLGGRNLNHRVDCIANDGHRALYLTADEGSVGNIATPHYVSAESPTNQKNGLSIAIAMLVRRARVSTSYEARVGSSLKFRGGRFFSSEQRHLSPIHHRQLAIIHRGMVSSRGMSAELCGVIKVSSVVQGKLNHFFSPHNKLISIPQKVGPQTLVLRRTHGILPQQATIRRTSQLFESTSGASRGRGFCG